MAADEQKALGHVLRILRTEGSEWMRHRRPSGPEAVMAARTAQGKFGEIEGQALERHFLHGDKKGEFEGSEVIWLKPPKKDPAAVAGIWCRWDYEKALPQCGFYYGLWSAQHAFPVATPPDPNKYPAFVGYRFETPEKGDNHNYYHAQPCRSMGAKDDPVEHGLPISERDPTWPLAATNALELLLCLVTALHGMDGLARIRDAVNDDPKVRRNELVKTALDKLLALRHEAD